MSKTRELKNAMSVYVTGFICSKGVFCCQTFKLVFCIYNMLHSQAESITFEHE